jgi:hypothetical protein
VRAFVVDSDERREYEQRMREKSMGQGPYLRRRAGIFDRANAGTFPQQAKVSLSAQQALDALQTIRLVTFDVNGQRRTGVTQGSARARQVLKALKLTNLRPRAAKPSLMTNPFAVLDTQGLTKTGVKHGLVEAGLCEWEQRVDRCFDGGMEFCLPSQLGESKQGLDAGRSAGETDRAGKSGDPAQERLETDQVHVANVGEVKDDVLPVFGGVRQLRVSRVGVFGRNPG